MKKMGLDNNPFSANKKENCCFSYRADALLKEAYDNLTLSGRGYDKIVKLARTVADMDGSYSVEEMHVLEAIQLRTLDKKYFGRY